MKNQNKILLQVLLIIICSVMFGAIKVEAVFELPAKYLDSNNQIQDTEFLLNSDYSSNENCPSNHKDPSPSHNNYGHAHIVTPDDNFPLPIIDSNGNQLSVTAVMSDFAWSNLYSGYTYVSGSTSAANCYAFAVAAPANVVLDESAWSQWTTSYTLCSHSTHATSTDVGAHAIVFVEDDEGCYLDSTIEKNASGPTWRLDPAPHGAMPPDTGPTGQNYK